MAKQIQKIKKYHTKYLDQTASFIRFALGEPKVIDQDLWYYHVNTNPFFKDEIILQIHNEIVTDVFVTQYFLWIPFQNLYYSDCHREYRAVVVKENRIVSIFFK